MSATAFHVRRGDVVVIISGKEKGKRGKVLQLVTKKSRVVVERLNMIKRHLKRSATSSEGGIVEREGTLHVSNVQLVCPKCDVGRRFGTRVKSDGTKERSCRKCGESLPVVADAN